MSIRNTYDNGTLVETLVDNGDSTGILTDYTTDPPTVTNINNLPIIEILEPSPEERIAKLEAEIQLLMELLNGGEQS
jgi:hypothetical protein